MRLLRSITSPLSAKDILSFAEMEAKEGVYRRVGHDTSRFVVLHSSAAVPCVLYINGAEVVKADDGWRSGTYAFQRTDETLEMIIK